MTNYITLTEAAKRCPNRPHTNSVWRWCRKGIKARSGEQIYLDHIRVGGTIHTTESAVHDFFEKVAQADQEYFQKPDRPAQPRKTSDTVRDRQIAKATAELEKAGI